VNLKGLLVLVSTISVVLFFSCTKINEATELGGDLIPAVDNVNTFDTTIDISGAYFPFDDSSKHLITENMALGKTNDPVFGSTTADIYFNLSSTLYGTYPYITAFPSHPDSLQIDSVVLSLSYSGSYGDTTVGTQLGVQVVEIEKNNGFNDTTLYRFDSPGFTTTGPVLGSKTFGFRGFKDTTYLEQKKGVITKAVNVLRIPLNKSLGQRLAAYDTTSSANGGYKNDTTFRKLFRGLAVKTTTASGNGALAYVNLSDVANSRLFVYFRVKKNGVADTLSATYTHATYSQANSIKRIAGGDYLANFSQRSSQKLFVQSSPMGSYVGMAVPELAAFPNKVIHRAELIAYKVTSNSVSDNFFAGPERLLLDHKGQNNSKDSAYLFENDLQPGLDGSLNFALFGGTLRSDNSYHFNITRYIQGIVTRKDRNDSLRLYAPFRSNLFAKNLGANGQSISIQNLTNIASGRVVLANGNFPDPSKRLRMRIIYSNL
jgi:hypothetical protein